MVKIGELAQASNLSVHTLRYYEKIGLMPAPARDGARHRDYGPESLAWIEFLGHLKATGMPIREMLEYSRLRGQAEDTFAERKAILERHRERVRGQMARLTDCLGVLDAKIAGYACLTPGPAAAPAARRLRKIVA